MKKVNIELRLSDETYDFVRWYTDPDLYTTNVHVSSKAIETTLMGILLHEISNRKDECWKDYRIDNDARLARTLRRILGKEK